MPEQGPIFVPSPEPGRRFRKTLRIIEDDPKKYDPDEKWEVEKPTLPGLGAAAHPLGSSRETKREGGEKPRNPFEQVFETVKLKDEQISEMIKAGLIEYGVETARPEKLMRIPEDIQEQISHEVHEIQTREDLEDEKQALRNLVAEAKNKKDRFRALQIEGEIFIILSALGVWFIRNSWEKVDEIGFENWLKDGSGLKFDLGEHTDNLINQAYQTARRLISKGSGLD